MALVKKDVLWPGTWDYPDFRFTLGPRDMRQAVENGNRMIREGLQVKWCWDHQPNLKPEPREVWQRRLSDPAKAAALARSVVTDVIGYELGEREGKPTVFAIYDDSNLKPEEREAIKRAAGVSCRLDENYREMRAGGGHYPGWSISHIAVTPLPVQRVQGKFVEMSSAAWPSDRTVFMGEGTPMRDAKDIDLEDDGADDIPEDEESPIETPVEVAKPEPPVGSQRAELMRLVSNLAGFGINLPESATDLKAINLALETLNANPAPADSAAGAGDAGGMDPADPSATSAAGGPSGGGVPMMMSETQMAKTHKTRVVNDRAEVASTIRALVRDGQAPSFLADKWLQKFSKVEMSYNASTGALVRKGILALVDQFRAHVPKGTFINGRAGRRQVRMSETAADTTTLSAPDRFNLKPDDANEAELQDMEKTIERIAKAHNPAGAKS